MATKILSSDKARAKWREVLDTAVAGEPVIIERYGNPIAVVISYTDYVAAKKEVREATAVYDTNQENALKAQLLTEIKAELLADIELRQTLTRDEHIEENYKTGWQALHQQFEQTGGLMPGLGKEEIVSRLRQTRQEIFEAEYAHLYR